MMGLVNLGAAGESYKSSVKNCTSTDENANLLFTFAEFKLKSININGEFNNFYKNQEQFVNKISLLIAKALPLLSKEKQTLFTKETRKANTLHLHRVSNKREVVEKILREYDFTNKQIENIFEGQEIYQLEVPYANGATRIIFHRIDNLISFLFVDPNHHVFFNKTKVEQAGSLYYEFCPVNEEKLCERMDYFGTCFAFEYLDEQKYNESYRYKYTPE